MIRIPTSTYRIQFNSQFTFSDAAAIVDYLKELGISDLYASPIFKAVKGSKHGYDVVDPNHLNPELKGEEEFEKLISLCHKNSISWLQDIVPNHMAYTYENQLLIDLFENGQNSRYVNFFDIQWNHPHASVRQRVLAPFLGKYYQEALEGGEIRLMYNESGFTINYYETRLPLKMESYVDVLSYRISRLRNKLGMNHPDFIKYSGAMYVLKALPGSDELDERYYQVKFVKGILWELYTGNPDIKDFIDETVKIFNCEREITGNYDLLDKLLSEQYFRLAYWKVATEEINYRRFFFVSELISLNMEYEETFNRFHSLIIKYVKEGKFNGLRVDHVDGLYDPKGYLLRLREKAKDSYIVVEKILETNETLPEDWPVQGTTGYEFMNLLNGLFCSIKNWKKINLIYYRFTSINKSYDQVYYQNKKLIISRRMAGDVERIAFLVEAVSNKDRYGIDITMHGLKKALEEILAFFPVYRTYIREGEFSAQDKKFILEAIDKIKVKNPLLKKEVTYIGQLLCQEYKDTFSEEQKEKTLDLIMRFQQLTGPIMAKGFEDTTLYVYNRFISLNEVGGNPVRFGVKRNEFYKFVKDKSKNWPNTLNSTSTHDTKRGEDVRARLNVLSELPEELEVKIKLWNKLNRKHKTAAKGPNYPVRNDEYFLYQTMLGSYPVYENEHETFITRLKEYMIKAVREAKVQTSWINPVPEYEDAVTFFVERILDKKSSKEFLEDFKAFQEKISFYGLFNSLSQKIIQLTAPGVPDIYQGAELWEFSMVDPDNRRPVDYELRRKYLKEIKQQSTETIASYCSSLLNNYRDSRIKLFVIHKILTCRNSFPDLFKKGNFTPLKVSGTYSRNIISFARIFENDIIITIVPRFLTQIVKQGEQPLGPEKWQDTKIILPEGNEWENLLTGEKYQASGEIPAGEVFKILPGVVIKKIS